ncbi:MAG: baseplate J/gp47 family protein [Candidatus Electrothrix scaldis]|nr:MAG: baseplate J/gp47 family protein [Candidatus Electrothrix sp. GW3-3]
MSLRSPNLDDRHFKKLRDEAISYAESLSSSSGWKPSHPGDPGDPGVILLELFAYLTDAMIYRVNRLPEKVYIELLRLIGVELQPPSAAVTNLRFSLSEPANDPVIIKKNTKVGCQQSGPQFMTLRDVELSVGQTFIDVPAIHSEWLGFTEVGRGTGEPGLRLQLPQAPLIAPTGYLDLIIAIEAEEEELPDNVGDRCIPFNKKKYYIWQEVETFASVSPDDHVYLADRAAGTISFAPSLEQHQAKGNESTTGAIAATPKFKRSIIARFRIGGGRKGNLLPDTLVKLIDKVEGLEGAKLEVTNPEQANGGSDLESLDNALIRGPLELHSLKRAVTAQDFELIAGQSEQASRVHAYTKHSHWKYADRGTVEVVLVPQISSSDDPMTPEILHGAENEEVARKIRSNLEKCSPLGSICSVVWCHYKTVKACVSLKVHQEEDCEVVKQRITQRLYQMINPLCTEHLQPAGWPFGQSITTYDIYRILNEDPGVKTVDPVKLKVSQAPSCDVTSIDVDDWHSDTWYAASGDSIFRSLNNGDGWECIGQWPDEKVQGVKSFPKANQVTAGVAGLVAVWSRSSSTDNKHKLYLSRDCGENWEPIRRMDYKINDIAWMERNGRPDLLVATENGLFVYSIRTDQEWKPMPNSRDRNMQLLKARSVAVATDQAGINYIAVATPPDTGVYLSVDSGKEFKGIGQKEKNIKLLKVQYGETQLYLWAGFAAIGSDPGEGCARWQLQESGDSKKHWKKFSKGWDAGTCTSLDFMGRQVIAGSSRRGVLQLNTGSGDSEWNPSDVNCGLKVEKLEKFYTVEGVAQRPVKDNQHCLLAVGSHGIYRSYDLGKTYKNCSVNEFSDKVTLPPTWLFCSDVHEVVVEHDQ